MFQVALEEGFLLTTVQGKGYFQEISHGGLAGLIGFFKGVLNAQFFETIENLLQFLPGIEFGNEIAADSSFQGAADNHHFLGQQGGEVGR